MIVIIGNYFGTARILLKYRTYSTTCVNDYPDSTTYVICDDTACSSNTLAVQDFGYEDTGWATWISETETELKKMESPQEYEPAVWELWNPPIIQIPYEALSRRPAPIMFRKTPVMRTKYFRGRRADK